MNTGPEIPVITTLEQTVHYFEDGTITLNGTCEDVEQYIVVYRNSVELPERIYHHESGTTFEITELPIIEGNNEFKVFACFIGLCSSFSNVVDITGVDTKKTVTSTFKLSSVCESFFYKLLQSTELHNYCISVVGEKAKFFLGIDEQNYPDDDFYISVSPSNKNAGETETTNDIYVSIAVVLKYKSLDTDYSTPYEDIKYEKHDGLLKVDEIGEKVREILSYEAQAHDTALNFVDYTIDKMDIYQHYICRMRIGLSKFNVIGTNSNFTW